MQRNDGDARMTNAVGYIMRWQINQATTRSLACVFPGNESETLILYVQENYKYTMYLTQVSFGMSASS